MSPRIFLTIYVASYGYSYFFLPTRYQIVCLDVDEIIKKELTYPNRVLGTQEYEASCVVCCVYIWWCSYVRGPARGSNITGRTHVRRDA